VASDDQPRSPLCGGRSSQGAPPRGRSPSRVSIVAIASGRAPCSASGRAAEERRRRRRFAVERRERALAGGAQRQVQMACVVAQANAADQPGVLERAQQAAQVAGVEIEVARELGGGRPAAPRELPEQARFGEREPGRGELLVQDADSARLEAVEATDRFGARGRGRSHALILRPDSCLKQPISC
jgi:hypothetical protein